jgi:hypothetical protein
VLPVRVDPTGRTGPTRAQARSKRWRRTGPGLFVPAHVDAAAPAQRAAEASALLPGHGAVTGWASLTLAGAAYFDGLLPDGVTERPVPLTAGRHHGRRATAGVRWLQDLVDPAETCIRLGVRCLTVERSLFDDMRRGTLDDAVVAADMAAAAEVTSLSRMRGYVDARPSLLGVGVMRHGLDLADENSWSPGESRLRLIWMLRAGAPRPLTNREVFARGGRILGIADLVDEEAGVVGEFDGGVHAGARQRSKDAARDARFRDHGLEVFRVTGYDLHDPAAVVDRIRSAYARARRRAGSERQWTLTPPPGWVPRPSLDDVLAQRDLLRRDHEAWPQAR